MSNMAELLFFLILFVLFCFFFWLTFWRNSERTDPRCLMEFLFDWSFWIPSIVFILTIAMELDLMNHCACWTWTVELSFFLSHSLMCICKTKIRTSFINQGKVNKGALYASLLFTSLYLGHLINKTLSITQGNSQSIVTTHKRTKQLLSGPLNCGIFIKHSVCRKRWLKSRVLYYNNSVATLNLSEITIARSGDVHPMPDRDSGSTMTITTRITNRSRRKYQPHCCPPLSRNNLMTIQCSNRLTADRCKQQLVLCNIYAQSVGNKSAVILDYICDHTPAIVSLTEHWLTDFDSSVRAELCPNSYNILDHTRLDRRAGIIYHESPDVKKMDAGVSLRTSYEFSEWIVKSRGYSIRTAIIYRPP